MTAAKNWIGEKSIHNNYSEFARGYIEYKVGNNGYVADVVVGIKENGTDVLYDLTNIYEKEIAETSYTDKEKSKSSRSDASADNNIPQPSEYSNTNSEIKDKKSKNDAFYFDDDGDLFFGDKAARESEVRFGKFYGIPNNNQFPPYRISRSEAHELAIRWANNPNVKSGDWKLASRHLVEEKTLMEESDVIEYLDKLSDTIIDFDNCYFYYEVKGQSKKKALIFKKSFPDGTQFSYNLYSNKKIGFRSKRHT